MTKTDITSFRGEYGFLSNFHRSTMTYEGMEWPTLEHAFQAAKTLDRDLKKKIQGAKTPGEAKRLGRRVPIRPDWEFVKERIMEELLTIKFEDKVLRAMLLDTGVRTLVEGNTWGDVTWGAVLRNGRFSGKNRLGELLMKVRKHYSNGSA